MNAVTRRTGTHDSNRSAPMSRLEAINTASVAMRYAIDLMEIVTNLAVNSTAFCLIRGRTDRQGSAGFFLLTSILW